MRLKPHGDPAVGSNIGLALVQNLNFSEGRLEIDLRGGGRTLAAQSGGQCFDRYNDRRREAERDPLECYAGDGPRLRDG